jgi:glycosyltransferase involved in cell wall biosynthesis
VAGDEPVTGAEPVREGSVPVAGDEPVTGAEPGAGAAPPAPHSPPRAAVYNRFWHSMGGGERHSGMIAQVLSADGAEVDLIGHGEVDREELAARLGLDLSRCTVRVVPDKGDTELARLSADYDLFVNSTYMSRLEPRSAHSAYLCFFPTPFDHDLARWRKLAIRTAGRYLRPAAGYLFFQFGTGWFPPEGGRRRRWTWTNGSAVLSLDPGPRRLLQADFGRVGAPSPCELVVSDGAGTEFTRFQVTQDFRRHRILLPATGDGLELHLRSEAFTPGPADPRSLGVAISRMRFLGALGLRERLALRFPWMLRDPSDLSFLSRYDVVLANSRYTEGWIERLWGTGADILYPPIDAADIHPAPVREPSILTVGRFFAPGLGHAKRQLEMVRFFGQIVRAGGLPGWTLHVVGGCEDSQRPYLERVRQAAAGLPVEIHANAPRSVVHRLMATSSIFWSATGYGEDEQAAPWAQEHFGMTTAEAMAGGCVPVVIDRAGQREIVREGVDGYRWTSVTQLSARTRQVAADEELRAKLSASAVTRAQEYSDEAFAARWREIAKRRGLLEPR